MIRSTSIARLFASLVLAGATAAAAQTINANSAAYNAGYGRTAGGESQPVNVQLSNTQGAVQIVNGQLQNVAAGSLFANGGGVGDSFSGAGGSGSVGGGGALSVATGIGGEAHGPLGSGGGFDVVVARYGKSGS